MLSCMCSYGGTHRTTIIGWASNSKDPTTYVYAIIEVLSFFSLWERKKFPYMPL